MDVRALLEQHPIPAPKVRGATFDIDRVLRVERFFRKHLRLTKGQWAGQPFVLEPWQLLEVIAPIFGWVDPKTGFRVHREAMLGIAKKNGKSPVASGIGLYGLAGDNEPGAEVYAAAGDKDQARIVFGQAAQMVRASPFLSQDKVCRVYRDTIHYKPLDAIFRVLSSDAPLKDGLQPHMTMVDELHGHRNGELYWFLRQGTVARRQPLTMTITTAGPEDEEDEEAEKRSIALQRYLHGKRGKDPRFYFRWYQAPQKCELTDFEAFKQANPASWRRTRAAHREVLEMGIPEFRARRFYFNQWVAADSEPAIDLEVWDRNKGRPHLAAGQRAWIGIDAALKRDSTAVALDVFDEENRVHNYEVEIFDIDEDTGFMPWEVIEDSIRELCRIFEVQAVGYDPFAFVRTAANLAAEGIPMVEIRQDNKNMCSASQAMFDAALEGRIRHGGDKTLREMVGAAIARETDFGWRFDKRKSRRKIDGLIACTVAGWIAEVGDPDVIEPTVIVG